MCVVLMLAAETARHFGTLLSEGAALLELAIGNVGKRAESMCLMQILMPATAQSNATNNSALPANIGQAINQTFGNYTVFKKNFTEAALSVFGSGMCITYTSISPLATAPKALCVLPVKHCCWILIALLSRSKSSMGQ